MVTYIEEMAVKQFRWLDGRTFKDGRALCQVLPGVMAMQLAAHAGLRIKGILGALLTNASFALPSFFLMLMLSVLYVRFYNLQLVLALFSGLQVTVVAIILNATVSFGKGCLKHYRDVAIALVAAVLFWLGASSFLGIIGAGDAGIFLFKDLAIEAVEKKQARCFT
jgi:chromate transporter